MGGHLGVSPMSHSNALETWKLSGSSYPNMRSHKDWPSEGVSFFLGRRPVTISSTIASSASSLGGTTLQVDPASFGLVLMSYHFLFCTWEPATITPKPFTRNNLSNGSYLLDRPAKPLIISYVAKETRPWYLHQSLARSCNLLMHVPQSLLQSTTSTCCVVQTVSPKAELSETKPHFPGRPNRASAAVNLQFLTSSSVWLIRRYTDGADATYPEATTLLRVQQEGVLRLR